MTGQFDPPDLQNLVKQLMAGASPAEGKALLDALMSGQVTSIFEKLRRDEAPELLPVPGESAGSECVWTCTARRRRSGAASNCPET